MSLPVPNLPLLRKALEWVQLEATKPVAEREWNQHTVEGDRQKVDRYAQRLLGLTDTEAYLLFYESRDLDAVTDMVKRVAARGGEEW